MQEEHHIKGKKLYICFVDMEKAFDSVERKLLEWAMRKKETPEALIRLMMSLYEEAKIGVRVYLPFLDHPSCFLYQPAPSCPSQAPIPYLTSKSNAVLMT